MMIHLLSKLFDFGQISPLETHGLRNRRDNMGESI